jgi:DMSO reductase anchor subunit
LEERVLVIFTLLAQTAAGTLVGLAGAQLLGDVDVLGPLPLIAVGLLLLVAAVISTLHLGHPRHAPFAVSNWRRSWLSREIVALGLTGGLVALGALSGLLSGLESSHGPRTLVGVLAAVAGVFLVMTMVRLYSMRTVTAWRSSATTVRFYGATLRLGGIGAGIFVALAALADAAPLLGELWIGALLLAGVGLESSLSHLPEPRSVPNAGALLVRRAVPAAADRVSLSRQLLMGMALAIASVVVALAGLPAMAMVLLVLGGITTVPIEVRLREHFYELAPSQGRLVARAAGR